ncbi:peroxiredoxin family protein [Haliscomenobacter hydrossis]|uniref:Alkyl hydroperoxide reductase/ Thiol specific antioxidant/ Mal allergen n=1 Tax=Haliscomenobacter hydrossis (strain ATCC 27775 / DSM 1100 / LMG 10767 / O) TaxID=760192 RepID=F4KZN2_HALH1|nr:TlpA disulfide reductase family protein [Haliscomenobacter hydrossis]AEE50468.1 alkyl hydroperoxide reductase/ Thiol specific antioxidant/ Mal allergen [Haliscomenobacter hydrossis DSM 1100]
MKSLKYIFLTISLLGAAFATHAQDVISVRCELTGCQGSLALFSFDGITFREVQRVMATNENVYAFSLPKGEPKFYYVGPFANNQRPALLGSENGVVIKGDCANIRQTQITGSKLNQEYDIIKTRINKHNNLHGMALRKWAMAKEEEAKKVAVAELKSVDDLKVAFLDSLKKANPMFARVAAINTYVSYPNNPGNYANEIEYFANEFFRFVDFKDAGYNGMPWVYENFSSYAQTLASVGLPPTETKIYLDKALAKFPEGGEAQQFAMAGVMSGLQKQKSAGYTEYAQRFIKSFGTKAPKAAAAIKEELDRAMRLMTGAVAPDFAQATPEGKDMKLSDLRGKYVLIDFWASWCGPCRRENPNVVRMYDQYKGKGFDILSVSLDNSRDKWLQAIEQDKLAWKHVSDLKGWSNEVAQMYEVQGIPKTFLIDPQGKIIATDLRGPSLEAKLAEIFKTN